MTDQTQPTPMLSIGEFARATSLSVSAVRFYGDRGLLPAAKVDPSSGYRSYESTQITTACLIRDLRLLGMSLAAIETAIDLSSSELDTTVAAHVSKLDNNLERARQIAAQLATVDETQQSTDPAPTVLLGRDLGAAFRQVLPSASTDGELPHLMTIQVEVRDGSVRIVATDSYRLAVYDLVPTRAGNDFVAVVAAATIRRLLPEIEQLDEVHLDLRDGALFFSTADHPANARVLPSMFPDYEAVLAKPEHATAVLVDRAHLRQLLESFDDDGAVLLSATTDNLQIERRGQTTNAEVTTTGPDVHVAVNPSFMVDSIDGAIGDEIVIEIERDPLRPVVFRSAADGTCVSVLMPFRLD